MRTLAVASIVIWVLIELSPMNSYLVKLSPTPKDKSSKTNIRVNPRSTAIDLVSVGLSLGLCLVPVGKLIPAAANPVLLVWSIVTPPLKDEYCINASFIDTASEFLSEIPDPAPIRYGVV